MPQMKETQQNNSYEQPQLDSTHSTEMEIISNHRRRYGKMVILFENERYLITLGPDYLCFIIAFLTFTILQIVVAIVMFSKFDNPIFGVLFIVGAILQQLSYILVAISNPGIATQADFDTEGQEQASQTKKFCKECNLPMLPKMHHCRFCGVCVKGYDHHCPWTSKCIGQNNLKRFYVFATITPLYLLLSVICLSI